MKKVLMIKNKLNAIACYGAYVLMQTLFALPAPLVARAEDPALTPRPVLTIETDVPSKAYNDIANPNRVVPVKTKLTFTKGVIHLPPHSLMIVKAPVVTQSGAKILDRISLSSDKRNLYPARAKNASAKLTLTGYYSDGSKRTLQSSDATIQARTKNASGNALPWYYLRSISIVPADSKVSGME